MSKHIGSTLDNMLAEDRLLDVAEAVALKRILSWQVEQAMKEQNITKTEMSHRMHTSRAALNRLLDPDNASVTLNTLSKAAFVLGKRLNFNLTDNNHV